MRGTLLTRVTVDYNSWIESDQGRKLAASLDKDVILVEGTLSCSSLITP
jgi:hypothetical protein